MVEYQKIIKKYGTPSYVYDIDVLLERVNYLQKKFTQKYGLVYAVKANTFIAKSLEHSVERYEICSPGEYDICDKLNISHQKMVISGVYKDLETIDRIMQRKDEILKYTVESINQYKLLDKLSKKYNKKIRLLIRLTSGNQFGVSENDLEEILKHHKNKLMTIDGIEYFSGTQKHSLNRINKEIDSLIELIDRLEAKYQIELNEIEYGPGLPVFYFQDDEFNEDEFLDGVKLALDKIQNKKVTLEIGRSMVASCGSYLTKVVDKKTNKYGNYVILDGGINHLVYYGQTMAMKIPYYKLFPQKDNNGKQEVYNLCGSLCTINDFLVKNITTRVLEEGDVFAFQNVGAYSSTEGISLFLSRDLPKVILSQNKKTILVREKYETSILNFPNNIEE